MSKRFLDNAEKTSVNENDAVPGTDITSGRDVFWKFKTIRDWIRTQIQEQVAANPPPGAHFGTEPPEDPYDGQVWFDASDGNKIYIWNGEEWEDVQRVLSLEDFGTGVKPVRLVETLPPTGSQGDVVFLTSDNKLYRWNGTAWVSTIPSSDITGQIVTAQIADAALTVAKFAASLRPVEVVDTLPASGNTEGRTVYLTTDDKLYRWTGSAWTAAVPAADITGTLADAQIAALAASKITGQLNDSQLAAIAAAKITGTITSTQITDGAISTPKLAAGAVVTEKLAAGAVTADNVAANAITAGKIEAGAVTTAKLAASAVEADKIAASAVTTDKLSANAVTTDKINANAITTGKIAAGAVTADQIAATAVQATHIAADAVTATKISAGVIQALHISSGAVEADKIAANAITAGKIQAGAITADKVGTNQIIASSANIADGVITSAKIGSLDAGKINAGNIGAINISVSGKFYNPAAPSTYFRPFGRVARAADTRAFAASTGWSFSHAPLLTLYGPAHASAAANPEAIINITNGSITFQIVSAIHGAATNHTVYYRKNGGAFVSLAAMGSLNGEQKVTTRGWDSFSGLAATDYFEFGVAPCDGNGDIGVTTPSLTTLIEMLLFN